MGTKKKLDSLFLSVEIISFKSIELSPKHFPSKTDIFLASINGVYKT